MKKACRNIFIFVFTLCVTLSFTACNNKSEESSIGFSVNRQLYDGRYIALSCVAILPDGIEFEVTNKSDEDIDVIINVSLDGIDADLWGDASDWEIPAHETKICKSNGEISNTEHKLMSIEGDVFVNSLGQEPFDICDFDIGGESNPDTLPEGTSMYTSPNVVIDYIGPNTEGIDFKVQNKRDFSITVGFDEFYINGENQDYAMGVITLPPHTTTIYSVDILSENPYYFSDQLNSFNGIMQTIYNSKVMETIPLSMGDSSTTTSGSETYNAYMLATNLTKKDLDQSFSGRYEYEGLSFVDEDCEWIDTSWNKEGTVELGALYRSIATGLGGFYNFEKAYGNWGSSIIPVAFGIEKPRTWEECKPYVDNASKFITATDSKMALLRKFDQMSCVSGTFDYENNSYSFYIENLTQAAQEMYISETMLGYCFAYLAEFAPEITFNDNSCTFVLNSPQSYY